MIAKQPDIAGTPELFASGRATIVLPEDVPLTPEGVPELRVGSGGRVDLCAVISRFAGQVVLLEGGPGLAGAMMVLGLVDEFFHTVAPKVIGGASARVSHGPGADVASWDLTRGFVDDDGYPVPALLPAGARRGTRRSLGCRVMTLVIGGSGWIVSAR